MRADLSPVSQPKRRPNGQLSQTELSSAQPDEPSPRAELQEPAGEDAAKCVTYPSGLIFPAFVVPGRDAPAYAITGRLPAAPLIEADMEDMLSDNFCVAHFQPTDEWDFVRIHPQLVAALEALLARLGENKMRGFNLLAGYQTPEVNRLRGDLPDSGHLNGVAAKISCAGVPVSELYQLTLQIVGDRGQVHSRPNRGYVYFELHHVDGSLA